MTPSKRSALLAGVPKFGLSGQVGTHTHETRRKDRPQPQYTIDGHFELQEKQSVTNKNLKNIAKRRRKL